MIANLAIEGLGNWLGDSHQTPHIRRAVRLWNRPPGVGCGDGSAPPLGALPQSPRRRTASIAESGLRRLQQVMVMQTSLQVQTKPDALPSITPMRMGVLQRKCACGSSPGPTGECAKCRRKRKLGLHAKLRVSQPGDPYEREADRVGDQVMRMSEPMMAHSALPKLRVQRQAAGDGVASAPPVVHDVLRSPGRPLDAPTLAYFEPRFGHDFGRVRVHTGATAAKSARAVNAYAYTFGNDIVFAEGEQTLESARGRRLLAHERTHVVQQGGRTPAGIELKINASDDSAEQEAQRLGESAVYSDIAPRPSIRAPVTLHRQPVSLRDIPRRERGVLQVITTKIVVPSQRVQAFFQLLSSGRHGTTQSVGATNSFGTGIPASLHTGLGSIGAWLAGNTNALPLGSSIEVALDLTRYGGTNSVFRFSYFEHTTGSAQDTATNRIMLIERVGAVISPPAPQTVPSGSFTVPGASFNLSSGWDGDDFAMLREALELLPADALTAANGLTFSRQGRASASPPMLNRQGRISASSPQECGHYNPASDTVVLYNCAFPATTSVRFGRHPFAVRNILHEVAHALDERVLQQAWEAFNSAGQTPSARRRFIRARSLSGTRYVLGSSGNYEQDLAIRATDGAFRQAVRRDGVRVDTSGGTTTAGTAAALTGGITSYSDTDYRELFAESFALYVSAPTTLRALRSHTYRYFERRYSP